MEVAPVDSAYGWVVAAGAFAAQFVVLGGINCFGVFFAPLHREFPQAGNRDLAAVVSVANFVAPMVGTAAGNLADRYGPRTLIAAAAVCQFGSYFLSAMVPRFWMLLLSFGVLAGLAAGCT
eukprot:RCo055181